MKKNLVTLLFISSLFAQNDSKLVKKVDSFKIDNHFVEVLFYDPIFNVPSKYPKFSELPENEIKKKSNIWNEYLHNNALYLFKTSISDSTIKYFCIRGNPEIKKSKMFFIVEIIEGLGKENFNPNSDNYSDNIVKIVNKINCGGSLFEHMEFFNDSDRKKYIGNGIKYLGKFRRVQPYSEIKKSIMVIIESNI